MFSNRNLAIVALVLIIGAASDGVLYNRPEAATTIYPLNDAQSIEIKYQDNVVLALQRAKHEWLVTSPFHAPARLSRVSLLLESNNQTARSYVSQDLQTSTGNEPLQSFPDPVELRVDGNLFLLGNIEPVSQLRYVSANDKVYLQADHIVPLLQSPRSTFTDLTIAKSVESVELQLRPAGTVSSSDDGGQTAEAIPSEQLSHWNDLDALMVINADLLEDKSIAFASVIQSTGDKKNFDIFHFQEHLALRPQESDFAYLISEPQAAKLGICVYC